jgi:hypothetical protein
MCSGGIAPLYFASVSDGCEWSVSLPGCFTTGERAPSTHWAGGWVGPKAGLGSGKTIKISCPLQGFKPQPYIPIACRYTDWVRVNREGSGLVQYRCVAGYTASTQGWRARKTTRLDYQIYYIKSWPSCKSSNNQEGGKFCKMLTYTQITPIRPTLVNCSLPQYAPIPVVYSKGSIYWLQNKYIWRYIKNLLGINGCLLRYYYY